MPFETLESAIEVAALPEGVISSLYVTPDIPNVDRFGGSLRTDPANDRLIYTNSEGEETVVDFRAGYDDGFGGNDLSGFKLPPTGQPAVFGDNLDSFLVPLVDIVPADINNSGDEGFMTFRINADGTVSAGWEFVEAFGISETTERFDVYPLGDGRVGYVIGNPGGDNTTSIGVFDDDVPFRESIAILEDTTGSQSDGIFKALPDGGTLLLLEDPDSTPPGRLEAIQYDSNDEEIASGYVDDFALENSEAEIAGIQIDENGELEVYYEVLPDGATDPAYFREIYDLLPAADDETVIPTEGDDLLTLTDGDDVIEALGGDDTVNGLGGQDWIIGGEGKDSIDGGRGDDSGRFNFITEEFDPGIGLFGGAGDDSINGREGADLLEGGTGNDDLRGGLGGDASSRTAELEVIAGLYGGDGDDFIRGNRGNDELYGGDGADDVNGGFGADLMFGGMGDDKMGGFNGSDNIFGEEGNDVLHGGRGDDALFGGSGDDTVRGAEGADRLEGGEGDDLLIGGAGADTFGYIIGGRPLAGGEFVETVENGSDTIKDFTIGEDTLELSGYATDEDGEFVTEPILTFEDIFLSQEDSVAVIQAGDTTIRLKGVDVEDLSEDDFLLS